MTQERTFRLYTYSIVHDPDEPRWAETGIPDIFFGSFEDAKAEVIRLRDDLKASEDAVLPPMRIEKVETLPLSKSNLLTLLNEGVGAVIQSYEVVETVG